MTGWIKLKRKLLKNPLWKDCNAAQKVVMITVLLMANHKPNRWMFNGEEYEVKAGEFITSLNSLVKETGLGKQQVRTALTKLEKHNFIKTKKTNRNTLVTIVNWAKYQGLENNVDNFVENLCITEKGEKLTQGLTQTLTQTLTQSESSKPFENKNTELKKQSEVTQGLTQEMKQDQHRPNTDLTPNKNDKNDKNDKKEFVGAKKNEQLYKKINKRLLSKFTLPSQAQIHLIDEWLKKLDINSVVKIIDYCTLSFSYPSYKNVNKLIDEVKNEFSLSEKGVDDFLKARNSKKKNKRFGNAQNFKQDTYKKMTKEQAVEKMQANNPALNFNPKNNKESERNL